MTNTTTETPSLCCVVSTLGKKIGMKLEGIFGWPELVVSDLRLMCARGVLILALDRGLYWATDLIFTTVQ